MNKHYLYRHIRLDKNEPFYIGIGTKQGKKVKHRHIYTEYPRAYSKYLRSDFWRKVVAKTEYEVEILLESDDYEFIKQKEVEFIALYGRRDLEKGTLVNLTDGGDGVLCLGEKSLKNLREYNSKNKSKKCVSFETGEAFNSLKEACEKLKLKYGTQIAAIRKKASTALVYYEGNYFERREKRTKKEKVKKLNGLNNNNYIEYHIIDSSGNEYKGNNILKFTKERGLYYKSLLRLIKNEISYSQGFCNIQDKDKIKEISKEIVIVNIKTKEVFYTYNLNNWCKENAPELYNPKGRFSYLMNVINKKNNLVFKTWWACHKREWTGEIPTAIKIV